MRLWEKELTSIEAIPGILIEFEDKERLEAFKRECRNKGIIVHALVNLLMVVDI